MSVTTPSKQGDGFQNSYSRLEKYDQFGHLTQVLEDNGSYRRWQARKSPNQRGNFISLGGDHVFRNMTNFVQRCRTWNLKPDTKTYHNPDGSYEVHSGAGGGGDLNDTASWFLGDTSDLINRSRVECLLKLNEGKVQLGTYLAESVKTADMLANESVKLVNGLIALKHRNWSYLSQNGFGFVRNAADVHLQMRYGWLPLMKDIYGLWKLSKEGIPLPKILHAKRVVSEHQHGSAGSFQGNPSTFRMKIIAICEVWATLDIVHLALAQNLGLANPLALGWELVPYSFVVDWFMPVGNYLAALTAGHGLEFLAGYQGLRKEGEVEFTFNFSGGGSQPFFEYSRDVFNSFPGIQPYAKSNPFKTSNVMTLGALITKL
jgi:hypothetical protein